MGADQTGTLVTDRRSRGVAFARLLSSAVISQTLLSAASFGIGLILIRHTTDVQYGYFILASSAIILLVSLQNAFFNPPLVTRMTQLAPAEFVDLHGILGHHHVTREKYDPGPALDWERFLEAVRARL